METKIYVNSFAMAAEMERSLIDRVIILVRMLSIQTGMHLNVSIGFLLFVIAYATVFVIKFLYSKNLNKISEKPEERLIGWYRQRETKDQRT